MDPYQLKVYCYPGLRICITKSTQLYLFWDGMITDVKLLVSKGVDVHLFHWPVEATLDIELEEDSSLIEYLCNGQIPLKYRHKVKQLKCSRYTLDFSRNDPSVECAHFSSTISLIEEGAYCRYYILSLLISKQRDFIQVVTYLLAENTEASIYSRVAIYGSAQSHIEVRSVCYKSIGVKINQDMGGLHITTGGEISFLPEMCAQQCVPEILTHQVKIQDVDQKVLEYFYTRGLDTAAAISCYITAFLC